MSIITYLGIGIIYTAIIIGLYAVTAGREHVEKTFFDGFGSALGLTIVIVAWPVFIVLNVLHLFKNR